MNPLNLVLEDNLYCSSEQLNYCEDMKLMYAIFSSCAGKSRRVQFLECPNDINGMIDAAKIADLALLLIDGSYGFEMVCC
jgi:hypothetical protein